MSCIKTKSFGNETTIQVTGNLGGEAVFELDRSWRRARSAGSAIQLDLCSVKEIDDAGKTLLTRMFGNGVELVVGAHKHESPRRQSILGRVSSSWRTAEN